MKKAIIYMEVACGCCGVIINRDYHNNKSVKCLWLYLSATMMIMGAEFNSVLMEMKTARS